MGFTLQCDSKVTGPIDRASQVQPTPTPIASGSSRTKGRTQFMDPINGGVQATLAPRQGVWNGCQVKPKDSERGVLWCGASWRALGA